ncbi:hypothetical protein J2R80_006652 [Bradyrhizobium sp. USDA 4541]|nr:hypothetical protein [Bradyrhizobium sp. USDA 4541]
MTLRPWKELTRDQRAERLGDARRWKKPAEPGDKRAAELLRRLESGEPLTRADLKEARALLRAKRGRNQDETG